MPPVIKAEMFSDLLQRRMPYNIILPAAHGESDKRYPVLYLLHGLFGSFENWTELTGIASYAEAAELILVMPEGSDSWYTDSDTGPAQKYESYLIDELLPEIDSSYRTRDSRSGRAIAGLSMGGYGALKFGIKYPVKFEFAASISGALDAAGSSAAAPGFDWENLGPSISRAFGAEGSIAREHGDLFKLIGKMSGPQVADLPFIYLDCGSDDGFIETSRDFARLIRSKKVRHEFRELPGAHDWKYWDERGKYLLQLAEERLK